MYLGLIVVTGVLTERVLEVRSFKDKGTPGHQYSGAS